MPGPRRTAPPELRSWVPTSSRSGHAHAWDEEELRGGHGRGEAASPTTGPPWRPAWVGCTSRGLWSLRVRSAGPEAASPRSQVLLRVAMRSGDPAAPSHRRAEPAGGWAEPAGRWAGRSRRAEGRSTAAAFSRPVSGAEPRGWPRGGDMLTFRDNSWYQSGNSDVVRHRQRERQREKERAGTGRSSRRQWP